MRQSSNIKYWKADNFLNVQHVTNRIQTMFSWEMTCVTDQKRGQLFSCQTDQVFECLLLLVEGYVQQADDVAAGLQTETVCFHIRSFKQTHTGEFSVMFCSLHTLHQTERQTRQTWCLFSSKQNVDPVCFCMNALNKRTTEGTITPANIRSSST